ncbi:unnamed protein product [Didymodactylos carnosus]|uniref:Apyrase n=1 Tax=Didymodactylos carnosus TaxID=1234261 RepID=A0A813YMM9_9BILA|nr:unnamed protein product [Didymodactylos carnosus]CAF0895621.1 unnamed protein product [Didymodactylos carnosus]CAF3671752.1 unnamed protein product [Didymodactylos carnosus]CAF3677167.1 unnamed protein product [Didymodactylos carnosus]
MLTCMAILTAFLFTWLLLGRVLSSNTVAVEKNIISVVGNGGGGAYVPSKENSNVHYGVVVDCGSSGTRLYIYVWPEHSGKKNNLLQIKQLLDKQGVPIVKKLEPGLSSMVKTPGNATEYMKSLLDFAAEVIPNDKHRETPLYIFATAGLRFLAPDEQKQILEDLFTDIVRDYRFQIEKTHIQVIPGKLEGIYSWIAINYVLGRFESNSTDSVSVSDGHSISISQQRQSTVGILDMGGASAQIAFEVASDTPLDSDDVAEFSLGTDEHSSYFKYKIYVTTFLGFGANKAYDKYIEQLIVTSYPALNSSQNSTNEYVNTAACLPNGYITKYERSNRTITLYGNGSFSNCAKYVLPLLNLNASCSRAPCSLNGVHQPLINYETADFYGFSEFWYTMEDILRIGGPYKHQTFLKASMSYCGSNWTTIRSWYAKHLFPKADLNRLLLQCFKSAWLYAFVHDGLKFPMDYKGLKSASLVNNHDVQWTLGAILYKTRFLPLRTINHIHSATHYRHTHQHSSTVISIICIIFIFLCLLLYQQKIRSKLRMYLSRRNNILYGNTNGYSNSNNNRYQQLSSVIISSTAAPSLIPTNGIANRLRSV